VDSREKNRIKLAAKEGREAEAETKLFTHLQKKDSRGKGSGNRSDQGKKEFGNHQARMVVKLEFY